MSSSGEGIVVEVCKRVSISGATRALSRAIEEGRFTHVLVRYMYIYSMR